MNEARASQGSRPQPARQTTSSSEEQADTMGFIGKAREKARTAVGTRLDKEKSRATQGLGSIVQAVRRNNEQLRSENNMVAPYIDRITERIERFAATMDRKDINEILADFQAFARRRPELELGISVAVGLAAARFLKSSGDQAAQEFHAA